MLHDGGFALPAGADHRRYARFLAAHSAIQKREFCRPAEESQRM
jgi:hypothetical protein